MVYNMEQQTEQIEDKTRLGTKEIARRVRTELKEEYPNCSFSVVYKSYSGGSSISINLMESNFKVIRDFKDISGLALFKMENARYTKEDIAERQLSKSHQLNPYGFRDNFNPAEWNNGVFLTIEGYVLFQRVIEIIEQYHYDHSDAMTDYFNTNFYINLGIGKSDKDFIEGV